MEQTFAETARARAAYGNDKVACATNILPEVQDYYHEKYGVDPEGVITFDSTTRILDLGENVENSAAQYLAIGWVNISRLEFFSVAREVFPVVVERKNYFTGDFYLLARNKGPADTLVVDDTEYDLRLDSLDIYLNAVTSGYPMLWEQNRLLQPGWMGFTNFFRAPLGQVVREPDNYLFFTLQVENPQPDFESTLICEVIRGDSVIYWNGSHFYEFTRSDYGRYRIHLDLKLADLPFDYDQDEIRVYLANYDEAYYYMNYFRTRVTAGNPVLYGLFNKIEY